MTDPKIPEMIFPYARSSTNYSPPSQQLRRITIHGKSALRVTMHASKTLILANSLKKRSQTVSFIQISQKQFILGIRILTYAERHRNHFLE